jgi:hypothetical protein
LGVVAEDFAAAPGIAIALFFGLILLLYAWLVARSKKALP